jgi:hypothetical protein
MIGTVERDIPGGQAIDQFLQGCRITMPTLPVKEVACITIQSLPDPEFVPFFLRKCHISSTSRTMAFPTGSGLAACSLAKRRIHCSTELARTPNIFPNAFMETP